MAGGVAAGAGTVGAVVVVLPNSAVCGGAAMVLTGARGPAPAPAPGGAAAALLGVPGVALVRFLAPPFPPFDGISISFSSFSICAIYKHDAETVNNVLSPSSVNIYLASLLHLPYSKIVFLVSAPLLLRLRPACYIHSSL